LKASLFKAGRSQGIIHLLQHPPKLLVINLIGLEVCVAATPKTTLQQPSYSPQPNMTKGPSLFLGVSPEVENKKKERLFKCMRLSEASMPISP